MCLDTIEDYNALMNSLLDGDYQEEIERERNNSVRYKKKTKLETIEIKLTPAKYLDSNSRYLRAKLINNKLNNSDIKLEVMHDKYNNYDSLALEVFCNGVTIGYIQKYNSLENINKFCFKNGKLINSLKLKWENNKFLLSREVPMKEPKLSNNEIIEIMANELRKDDYFKNIQSIWANWDDICEEINNSIENSDDELFTQQEYREFIRNHTYLYFDKIKEITELKIKEEQEKEEEKRRLEEQKKEEEERKRYLESPEGQAEIAKREKEEKERREREEKYKRKINLENKITQIMMIVSNIALLLYFFFKYN